MADFFKNNKLGLGAAVIGGLIAAAFTKGGSLLVPLLVAGVGFVAPGLLGKEKDGIVTNLLSRRSETPAGTPAADHTPASAPIVGDPDIEVPPTPLDVDRERIR